MKVELAAGIDVSHYKKRVDWKQVKESGVNFAFIKATEAENFVDSRFDYNWTRTRREGIVRGAYHFFRPLVDPVLQAQNFLKIVGPVLHSTDLPPVLDVEVYPEFVENEYKRISVQERIQRISVWLQTIEKATGKVPIIYTEYYTWFDYIGDTERFIRHPLWIANFRVDKPKVPANNWGGKGWSFWQTTERGIVPGIRDEAPCVDLDIYHDSLENLREWLGIDGPRPPAPDVTNGDMMAALVDAADRMGISSNDLVERTCLSYLVDPVGNSLRPYDGPAISEMLLDEKEKRLLAEVLSKYEGRNATSWNITHQDMINAFYYAASLEDIGGWSLVDRAGLGYIGLDRDELYTGPIIAELTGLTEKQKEAISAYLGVGQIRSGEEAREEILEVPEIDTVQEGVEEEPQEIQGEKEDQAEKETSGGQEDVESEENTGKETLPPTYSKEMDNQAVINAFYLAALKLEINGHDLISCAGLANLSEQRTAMYTGPKIEDLPGMTKQQKEIIAELLLVDLPGMPEKEETVEEQVDPSVPVNEPEVEEVREEETAENSVAPETEDQINEEPIAPTYMGLVNQDIIDLFYDVASIFNENGWDWIVRTGLGYLAENRRVRFKMYNGPKINQISGLSKEQKSLLVEKFDRFRQ